MRYQRKHAIRVLAGPAPGPPVPRRRAVRYGAPVIEALRVIWTAAGYPWSRRLKALPPLWLPWARRRRRLRPAVEQQVLPISCSARRPSARASAAAMTLRVRPRERVLASPDLLDSAPGVVSA